MRRVVLVVGLLALWVGPAGAGAPAGARKSPATDEGEDILVAVRALNGPEGPRPPGRWRKGHVSRRQFPRKATTRTKQGFQIQMPGRTALPTPTVKDGVLYVGGGFNSKQFHAFDARSGKVLWAVNLDDDGPSSAVVEDGVVVFNTESCTVFALDARNGKMLWSWWLGDPLTSTPTIADGRVFTSYPAMGRSAPVQQQAPNQHVPQHAGSHQHNPGPTPVIPTPAREAGLAATHVLAAFDLKTGKVLWQRWIDSDVMSAPVATADGEVHATTFSGTQYVFAQRDGEIRSARRTRATSAAVVVGQETYYTRRDDQDGEAAREAMALAERDTGRVRAKANPKGAVYLDRKVQRSSGYAAESLSQDAGNGFGGGAPAAANPEAAWNNVGQGNVSSMQAFQGSRIVHLRGRNYNVMGDEIVAVDARTGKTRWSRKISGDLVRSGGALGTAPAVAGGHLFVATLDGKVKQIDTDSGVTIRTYEIGAPVRFQPAIEDGRLYVGTQDGRVVCVDTGDRKLTGWSTWGGNSQHTGVAE